MLRAPKKRRDQDEDDEMLDAPVHLVVPGETITSDLAFMRGHGTYNEDDSLVASVLGVVDQVNKLISVRPLRARFNGEIGDVVVGRILEVGQKRWKVDIAGKQDAVLPLAAVDLPGGELAEIQAFFHDGAVSLHTRSLKYGK
ncbi:Exosome complex component RRP4, partial [Dinochytrium kinnereticum]